MNESLLQLEALFTDAVALPAASRAEFLDRACAGDTELRARVEGLLRASGAIGGFLEAAVLPGVVEAAPGAKVGRYKLLEKLGEGGVGVVFMAEQQEPVRRKVALKVIKPGMDSREVIARFESERQALALMDHPNIARVLDAGATGSGRPYFVMELVRGIKITDYCDQNHLTTEERLKLFLPVCGAIQHAHQKGVIHRDIKPSNTLVTLHDGAPVPKVIDFGIAKATQGRLTDKTLFTSFAQFIGTPAYMSPEQAEMSGLDVDTRTDVYSLGVLLYELLTGRTPFDAQELNSAGIDEIRKRIREVEPPKLLSELRGDLEWIVGRCLEKDRARRYETANALAMDLQRHLHSEPVVARPPSTAYRLQKTIARHRLAFGAATAIAVSLVGGLALSTISLFREKAARARAVAAEHAQSALRREAEAARNNEAALRAQAEAGEKKAEAEAARSARVAASLSDVVAGIGPKVALGRTSVRDFLLQTEKHANAELGQQPDVLAAMHETLGRVYFDLGDYDRAVELHRAALAARRRLLGERHADTASSLDNLGVALWKQPRLDEAEKVLREAVAIRRELFGEEHRMVASSLFHLSVIFNAQRRHEETAALRTEVLALRRKLLGAEHPDIAESLFGLANSIRNLGRIQESDRRFREALAMQRKLLGPEHPDVAETLSTFGNALSTRGPEALIESLALTREALAIRRKVLAPEHPLTMTSLYRLADNLARAGRHAEAEIHAREWIAVMPKMGKPDATQLARMSKVLADSIRRQGRSGTAAQLAVEWEAIEKLRASAGVDAPAVLAAMNGLAQRYREAGMFAEGLALAEETLARQRRALGPEDAATIATMENVGRLYLCLRRPREAVTILGEAVENSRISPNLDPKSVPAIECLVQLGFAQVDAGEPEKAREPLQEAVNRHAARSGWDSSDVAARRFPLGLMSLRAKDFAAAEADFRAAWNVFKATHPDNFPRFLCEGYLGLALAGLGKYDEAESMMVASHDALQERRSVINTSMVRYVDYLGKDIAHFYATAGRAEKAVEWKAKITAAAPPQTAP